VATFRAGRKQGGADLLDDGFRTGGHGSILRPGSLADGEAFTCPWCQSSGLAWAAQTELPLPLDRISDPPIPPTRQNNHLHSRLSRPSASTASTRLTRRLEAPPVSNCGSCGPAKETKVALRCFTAERNWWSGRSLYPLELSLPHTARSGSRELPVDPYHDHR
jgi:hypothetical protein